AAVVTAELLPALTNPFADFTVFAPSDAAFDDLAAALGTDIPGLLADPGLADILLYHVLDGAVMSSMISNGDIVTPLNDANTIKLTKGQGDIFVNQALVELADVGADNGVVHAIDAVILPSETVADVAIDNGFNILAAAAIRSRLLPALTDPFADFTVFAPSDEAFISLANALGTNIQGLLANPDLPSILLYHVLDGSVMSSMINNGDIVTPLNDANTLKLTATSGGDIFVNQAGVFLADVGADNGIVHAIDGVLLSIETVVDIAIDNEFTALTAAVVTAELLPALTDPFSRYTVFAPTDEAFVSLAEALDTDLEGLLALPNLADILLYHVVGEELFSFDLEEGTLAMLNGQNTIIDLSDGVQINNATVVGPNNGADNGVVHIINEVLDLNFFICDSELIQTPQNLQVIQSQNSGVTTFTWDPVPGSVGCQLRFVKFVEGDVQRIRVDAQDGVPPSEFTVSNDLLNPTEIYEVSVRCACSEEPLIISDFSASQLFISFGTSGIQTEDGVLGASGNMEMSVYPNPSNLGFINVNVSNNEGVATEGLIEVRDVTGRSITAQRVAIEANQTMQIETVSMPAGMYTVSYTTDQNRVTERFMVR
ncbi:MAG: fasciclin domain-containing protein, partial [Bacteroidota bacterium]